MDEMVLMTQKWLNETYGKITGFDKAPENGKTGWSTTIPLVEALQIELGFEDSFTGTFGPATLAACPTLQYDPNSKPTNIVKILQGGMWCKGYSCDGLNGVFGKVTESGIKQMQEHMGITSDGIVTPEVFCALLNMNAYVLLYGGNEFIREFQQFFNKNYSQEYYGREYIPCDGLPGRKLVEAVTVTIQAMEGFGPSEVTGFFGETSASHFPILQKGDESKYVYPLQVALAFNNYYTGVKSELLNNEIEDAVVKFKEFMALDDKSGIVDGNLMQNLLTSTGDADRNVYACDSAKPLTQTRINTLKGYDYFYIGRYITPGQFSWGNKQLTVNEIELILENDLRIFPIFQSSGNYPEYFTSEQGEKDGNLAINYASSLNIPDGTIIYFAVDYDFMDGELDSTVIPYFKAINRVFNQQKTKLRIGIYASRNICTRLKPYTVTSFVSGLSTGFSGNLGYPMPTNWAFNQILTINSLDIDNDAVSGKDLGFGKDDYHYESEINDKFYEQLKNIYNLAYDYSNNNIILANKLTAMFIRHKDYNSNLWDYTAGKIDYNFVKLVETKLNINNVTECYDPETGLAVGITHLMATLNALLNWEGLAQQTQRPVDVFSSWGGDLATLIGQAYTTTDYPYMSFKEIVEALLAGSEFSSYFSYQDYMADLDAFNIQEYIRNGASIYEAITNYYTSKSSNNNSYLRTNAWINSEYDGSLDKCLEEIEYAMTTENIIWKSMRDLLNKQYLDETIGIDYYREGANVFKEYVKNMYNKEK